MIREITTGEQTGINSTGAITGTLDTSALSAAIANGYSVKLRVRGLTVGKKILLALEDTANASAFSDTVQVAVFHLVGTGSGAYPTTAAGGGGELNVSVQSWQIPLTRIGAANTKFRINCLAIDAAASCSIYATLEP